MIWIRYLDELEGKYFLVSGFDGFVYGWLLRLSDASDSAGLFCVTTSLKFSCMIEVRVRSRGRNILGDSV